REETAAGYAWPARGARNQAIALARIFTRPFVVVYASSMSRGAARRSQSKMGRIMRHLFLLLAAASIAAAASGPAAAQNRPPIETTKVEGTDNVYIFRNVNHQSMFIVTGDGVIATDPIAYGRPTGGQTYVDEIRKVTDKPIKYLIYSHHHYDHIAG